MDYIHSKIPSTQIPYALIYVYIHVTTSNNRPFSPRLFPELLKITKQDANLDQYHVEASLETSYLIKHRTFV
jgi:hypothetical protein